MGSHAKPGIQERGTGTIPRLAIALAVAAAALITAAPALAVPMRPVTYSVEGEVKEVSWHSRKLVKVDPKTAVFPCSPKGDYYRRAYYQVVLTKARRLNRHWHPKRPLDSEWLKLDQDVDLRLDHPADDMGLRPGMRLGVYNYTINGDECGRWTSYDGVQVLDEGQAKASE